MESKYVPAGVSPLPWHVEKIITPEGVAPPNAYDPPRMEVHHNGPDLARECGHVLHIYRHVDRNEADARYIAHAANMYPELCAALEKALGKEWGGSVKGQGSGMGFDNGPVIPACQCCGGVHPERGKCEFNESALGHRPQCPWVAARLLLAECEKGGE